jgi:hypothetical protein
MIGDLHGGEQSLHIRGSNKTLVDLAKDIQSFVLYIQMDSVL